MRFDVSSRKMVENYSTEEKHINISIANPKAPRAKLPKLESRVDALFITCADSCKVGYKVSKGDLFNKSLAEAVWRFVDKYKDEVDLIVVNCELGISRSSGMSAAISKILNGDDMDFFKYFIPNMDVYRKMMEVKS